MRLGIVIDEFDPARGGMEQWCLQFVAAVASQVHEVHIVAQHFGEAFLPANVSRHELPRTKSRMCFASAAERHVEQLELDVVHDMGAGWCCDLFQPHGGSHLAWLARGPEMHAPWIWSVKRFADSLLPRRRDAVQHCRRQFAPSLRGDKKFIALCNMAADDFVRFHHIRPEQIDVIYNGVDCRRYSPEHRAIYRDEMRRKLRVDEETLVLLLATHSFRRKGLGELLSVVGQLIANGRPVHLVVAGRGRLAKWRRTAARLGVEKRVTFLGGIRDIVPWYAAADLCVHPTYYDQCSLVILEAAASGLPIVTTRRSNGTTELFREGSEILTIDNPRDLDGLYRCIEAHFDEPTRRRLGEAARSVALRHTFEQNVAAIMRLYDDRIHRRLAA
jgi:UDP-glucose:(heptosyl)LPS alpha-1,3-glucosyltransferase